MSNDIAALAGHIDVGHAALLALSLAAGYLAGYLHFRSLQSAVERMVAGDLTAFASRLVRFAILGIVFWLFARQGAAALLCAAGGVLIARWRILSRREQAE